MSKTVELDELLLAKAKEYSGLGEDRLIVEAALTDFIQREASRRLAELGGTMPNLEYPRRRRSWSDEDDVT